jgi:hypothetical protein
MLQKPPISYMAGPFMLSIMEKLSLVYKGNHPFSFPGYFKWTKFKR